MSNTKLYSKYRELGLVAFLTCCDNKKQQTDVELHFQSWDISVSETLLILNPYRVFRFYDEDETNRAKHEKWSPVFFFPLRTVPNQTKTERGVRNFPSPSFPPNGNRCAVRECSSQHSHLNKWDTRVSDRQRVLNCVHGRRPSGCSVRSFESIRVSKDERKESSGRGRSWFLHST